METKKLTINNWYSARYENGFSIIFRVLEIDKGGLTLCRKDGAIIDSVPQGYKQIVSLGQEEPDYE